MDVYIILIACEGQCIDLQCEFSHANHLYTAKITDPFDSTFVITEDYERKSYVAAAKYILDKGRIISIIPLIENDPLNFFRVYLRIEEIDRHLLRMKDNIKLR